MHHKTPLYNEHEQLNAKIVDFHGWLMPIQYSGIIDEHCTVREKAGLFDLSHMGELDVFGDRAREFLQEMVCSNMNKIVGGQMMYTALLNKNGGIIDDIVIAETRADWFLLIVNASNREAVYKYLKHEAKPYEVDVRDESDEIALIAIQGPLSKGIISNVAGRSFDELYYYECCRTKVCGKNCIVSRTGYTGEDGFEIFTHDDDAPLIWNGLLKAGAPLGLKPIGLGARDTLRLEAGYRLHGNDIDPATTPFEAGLSWLVDMNKKSFVGKSALENQKAHGVPKRAVLFEMVDRGIPRHGYPVTNGVEVIGHVTSGTQSPSLNAGIGMAYIDTARYTDGEPLYVVIHGKPKQIAVKKGSFIRPRVYKRDKQ